RPPVHLQHPAIFALFGRRLRRWAATHISEPLTEPSPFFPRLQLQSRAMGIAGRGAGVLIADDKADIRMLLAARLGLEPELEVVGEASNGAEAITKVGELHPAALILDLQMPVMSGEEAIPILRSLAPDLRILVFSAYVGVEKDLSGSWRPDAEIAKGGDLRLLVEEVHRLLAGLP